MRTSPHPTMASAIKPHDPELPVATSPGALPPPPPRSRSSPRPPLLARARGNLAFRARWESELNGAMGDLGTYVPIVLALALAKDLDLGTTLIFTGIYNIVTGLIYGVPMPVQPMKSIAAVAISSPSFSVPEIMAAGICTSAVLFLLGATRLMEVAYWLVPLPVVRGIQLAQGLSFAMSAVKYVRYEQDLAKAKSLSQRPWTGLDGLVLAIVATCFIVIVNGAGDEVERREEDDDDDAAAADGPESGDGGRRRRSTWKRLLNKMASSIPSAVIVFVLGVILAVIRKPSAVKELRAGPSPIEVVRISRHAWKDGFVKGAIPQLPLSILNSVIAVCKLTKDLFPERAEPSAASVAVTVGAMNLVGCWFGAMPCCHGAAKLALGLVLGASMLRILVQFPVGLLGVLLLFAGVELAIAARDMATRAEAFVALVCAAVSLVGSSAALGFVCGMIAHGLVQLRKLMLK
ncbi:molybdate transporter 1-like [Ananas comosus]|uniref:Molybdate transporter 1-like n=1 Tax=Ananas comosus TaxID=4615 RepID=A0A6P5HMN4_ANACO|nr:molybdate transporter 1-like [Ananas comosus]